MKKFLLVIFVGLVLAINIYGIVNKLMVNEEIKGVDHVVETTVTVYME